MPFAAGTFALFTPGNPVVTGTTIASTWANSTLTDIATGLSTAILKDGSQTVTANIPFSGFKLTGIGAASAAGDAVRFQQHFTTTALTDQATITWDASLAPVATVTLAASRIMAAPTGLKAGGLYGLFVTQDGTGGRTLTWNAVFKGQGGGTMPQPETTLSTVTAFVFYSPDGTNLNCVQCMPFIDTNYIVRGSADPTKKVRFEVDGLTTATTRVITMPDTDVSLSGLSGTQTANTVYAGPTTGVAALPTFRALSGGESGLTLLGSQAASASATLTFVNTGGTGNVIFDWTAFDEYVFELVNILPATDNQPLNLNISTDAGTTYKSDASYVFARHGFTSANAAASSGNTGQTTIPLIGGVGNSATGGGVDCTLRIYKPTSSTANKHITWHIAGFDSTNYESVCGMGAYTGATTAITGVKFSFAAGNITSGVIYAYGIRKA